MDIGIFSTGTMACIDGELEHVEAILEKFFSEGGIVFPVFFRVGRQVEENEDPHNPVFANPVHGRRAGYWMRLLFPE